MLDNTLLLIRSQEIRLIFSFTFSSQLIRKFFPSHWSEFYKEIRPLGRNSIHKGTICFGRDLQIPQRSCWNTEMFGLDLTMGIPQHSVGLWMWQGSHWFTLATLVKSKLFETTADACPEDQGKTEHSFRTTTIFYCRLASPMSFCLLRSLLYLIASVVLAQE